MEGRAIGCALGGMVLTDVCDSLMLLGLLVVFGLLLVVVVGGAVAPLFS